MLVKLQISTNDFVTRKDLQRQWVCLNNNIKFTTYMCHNASLGPPIRIANGNTDKADEVVFQRAVTWLQQQPTDKPYLLTINNHSTHSPFRVPSDFEPDWAPDTREARYQKALSYFDQELGVLLDALEERPDFERTVLLVIGDHGFPIQPKDFDPPQFYGYQKTEMVAGIFSKNRALVGEMQLDTNRVVAQVDIAPTILDLVGVEAPHHFQGRSWLKPESAANHHRYALFYKNDTFSLHSAARTYYGQVDARSDSSPLAPQAVDLAALLAYTIHQDQVWEPLLIESPKEFLKTLKDTLHWPSNE